MLLIILSFVFPIRRLRPREEAPGESARREGLAVSMNDATVNERSPSVEAHTDAVAYVRSIVEIAVGPVTSGDVAGRWAA